MFKLPGRPSPKASVCELADFMELWAWQNGQVSCTEVLSYLGRIDDNDHNEGCEDDDGENAALLDEVLNELDRRFDACDGAYPFRFSSEGTVVRHVRERDSRKNVYRYLLLSTRLNMTQNKVQGGVDGTKLMESLCAAVLKNYLGSNAKSLVFGTAIGGTFKDRIESLCKRLGEGVGFRSVDVGQVSAQDDKLDAVAWTPFPDKLPGQLVFFAQCKTGTNWTSLVSQLQPVSFMKRWLIRPLVVDPMRVFCVTEVQDPTQWNGTSIYSGILFDRCRLAAFSGGVRTVGIESWSLAALKTFKVVEC